jgi:hypothetical protein
MNSIGAGPSAASSWNPDNVEVRHAGEHEDLGDILEANDAHKDRVWQLGAPAQQYSAPGLPQRKYASVAVSLDGLS